MARWVFLSLLPLLVSCGLSSTASPGAAFRLSVKLLLPMGATSGVSQSSGAVTVSPISVTGVTQDSVCQTSLDSDSVFSCDVPTGLSGVSLLLVSYSLPSNPNITYVALLSPSITGEVVIGSLDDLVGQRALFLMGLGVSASSALQASQQEVSAAIGGLSVTDSQVVAAMEQSFQQLAQLRGIANYVVLTDLFQQDFSPDGVFDGTGANGGISSSGYTLSAQDWLDLGNLELQSILASNASGLNYATFVAAPPLPAMVDFLVLEPLSVATQTANVVVSWSNALANSYNLVVSSTADCASPVQSFAGLTNTSQVLAPLSSNSIYYICLTALGDNGATLTPEVSNLGAISFRTPD